MTLMIGSAKHVLRSLRRIVIGLRDRQERVTLDPALRPQILGKTVQGQDIPYYSLGNGKRAVFVVAGIHGNEVGTVLFARRLINELTAQPIPNLRIIAIPSLNPDGQAIAQRHPDFLHGGRIGRFNARSVDLNRNFPTATFQSTSIWSHGKNYQDKTEVYCGESGGSEPETQAFMQLVEDTKPIAILAFHNAGADVTGPPDSISQAMAKAFSEASGYRLVDLGGWDGLGQSGTMNEWAAEQRIPYVEVEGAKRWGSDWPQQWAGTQAVLKLLSQEK